MATVSSEINMVIVGKRSEMSMKKVASFKKYQSIMEHLV
jgi:hypothetical protein